MPRELRLRENFAAGDGRYSGGWDPAVATPRQGEQVRRPLLYPSVPLGEHPAGVGQFRLDGRNWEKLGAGQK